jgi:hypothetical protein
MQLFRQRSVWMPTWQGWCIGLLLTSSIALVVGLRLYPFLAVTAPVEANVLVVEGWCGDYVMAAAQAEFERGGYDYVCASGIPLRKGGLLTPFKTEANVAAATLQALGIPTNVIIAASSANTFRHRTFTSAVAVRERLDSLGQTVRGVNLMTEGIHARRSRMVYRKVFPASIPIGVISHPTQQYDPESWYRSSDGIKDTLTETIGVIFEAVLDSGR